MKNCRAAFGLLNVPIRTARHLRCRENESTRAKSVGAPNGRVSPRADRWSRRSPGRKTSAAYLKSLRHKRRPRSGTSDRSSGTKINRFAGAYDLPKFVMVGAAMEHELRKVGLGLRSRWFRSRRLYRFVLPL